MIDRLTGIAAVSILAALPFAGCGGSTPKSTKKCADLECGHQVCQEASGNKDAVCLEECETGFVWNTTTSVCDPLATCTSLDCESQGRTCLNNPAGATCGDCLSGYRLDGADCVEITSCEAIPSEGVSILNLCAAQGRECVELVTGEAECGDCLQASHVIDPDSGVCRTPLTCRDITCDAPLICNEFAGQDAFCDPNCQGPNGEPGLPNSQGVCILCPLCDDTAGGEAGPYLGGLTGEGRCICETAAGYYWQEGEPTGVTPCDRDGDGWVRFSANGALSSSTVVQERAHCEFREIEAVVLHNERGDTHRVPLTPAVRLIESDRNDDIDILTQQLGNSTRIANFTETLEACTNDNECAPSYVCVSNACVRPPKPEELNSLTKYCVNDLVDYNHNAIADVDEWHESTEVVHPVFQPLLDFAYFGELHRGWFEYDALNGNAYHIAEKSRDELAEAGWKVPLVRPEDGNDYWRSCARMRDKEYLNPARADKYSGLDFAWAYRQDLGSGEFPGMTHHSQFKCHEIVNSLAAGSPAHWTTKSLIDSDPNCNLAGGYNCRPTVNTCTATETSGPDAAWNALNPSSVDMTCVTEMSAPNAPAVTWVAYGYYHYPDTGLEPDRIEYLRSCVNECEQSFSSCPICDQTWESCPGSSLPGAACEANRMNYGEMQCGCGRQWGGAGCDFVCIEDNVLTTTPATSWDPSNRTGHWMCAEPTATYYVNADESGPLPYDDQNRLTDGAYILQGSISVTRPVGESLCQFTGCATGYILR